MVILTHYTLTFLTRPAVVGAGARFQPMDDLPVMPWTGPMAALETAGFEPGAFAVLLFFLVSGFVIPFSLASRDLKRFGIRRFFRLYPVLWVCLLLTFGALALQAGVSGIDFGIGGASVAANGTLLGPYFGITWFNPVLWSLAVEELFYLVAALVAWRGKLNSSRVLAGVVAALAVLAVGWKAVGPGTPGFWLWFWLGHNATCVIFVLVGLVFHLMYQRTWNAQKGAAAIAAMLAVYAAAVTVGPMNGVARIYLVSAALALAVFAGLYLVRDAVPYSKTLDRLSNISYPLYLIHGINGYIILRAVLLWTGSYTLALGTALAVSFALATAIHRWVEIPSNRAGRRLALRGRTVVYPPPVSVLEQLESTNA
jgi:peptidoglycan/LPS O-acetylase OafA/YrhL